MERSAFFAAMEGVVETHKRLCPFHVNFDSATSVPALVRGIPRAAHLTDVAFPTEGVTISPGCPSLTGGLMSRTWPSRIHGSTYGAWLFPRVVDKSSLVEGWLA